MTIATACSEETDENPESVVRAVTDARAAGDCDDYSDFFVDGDVVGRCQESDDPEESMAEIREAKIDDDTAEVEAVEPFDCSTWDEPDVQSIDVYFLVLDDGEWLVDDIDFADTTSDDCFT